MDRRTVLKGIAALAASSRSNTVTNASAGEVSSGTRRFVDIHCHFFNASDLPIRGFLERVALADYAQQKASAGSLQVWRGMVAQLADFVLRRRAPTPQEELLCLRDAGSCSKYPLTAGRSAKWLDQPSTAFEAEKELLTDVLQQHFEGGRAARSRTLSIDSEGEDINAFIDFLQDEMRAQAQGGRTAPRRTLEEAPAASRGVFSWISEHIQSGSSLFSRYFQWASLLRNYRANIASTYIGLYDPNQPRLTLATPALVDYNFWLQDQSPASLAEQIELMGLLSLKLPRPVHGFAPFDPLREVKRLPGETSSLKIVQNAVADHGFLGVKLYSPMGFRPSGNAEAGLQFPAHAAMADKAFGHKLDEALDRLYAWCAAEDVPIMAHTTDSQSAGPDFASRAEPKFWEAVLKKYPGLRVNLAHFGNFSQAKLAEPGAAARFELTWEYEIGGFVKSGRYPNVYADISYFYWVLEGSGSAEMVRAARTMFERYLREFDPRVERLMFGTDWNMTGKAKGFEQYLDSVEKLFQEIGLTSAQLDNLFHNNAIRFLGLNAAETKASKRLADFYRGNGREPPPFSF